MYKFASLKLTFPKWLPVTRYIVSTDAMARYYIIGLHYLIDFELYLKNEPGKPPTHIGAGKA